MVERWNDGEAVEGGDADGDDWCAGRLIKVDAEHKQRGRGALGIDRREYGHGGQSGDLGVHRSNDVAVKCQCLLRVEVEELRFASHAARRIRDVEIVSVN